MQGARSWIRPLPPAKEPLALDEAERLEFHLQTQFEEDIAKIFDESIYTDLEVVCGKLKILTHSCILKARANKFYHKLETILHVSIGQNAFDEIYSFISDAYTECNIKHQEKEIITYLDDNFNVIVKSIPVTNSKEEAEEPEVFSTPKSISPIKENIFEKNISASPSTELTKEYYALVPIEGNFLDKELIEQDVLSNAFHSINKTQSEEFHKLNFSQCNKPTTLSLSSSHASKTVAHSNSCDSLIKCHVNNKTPNLVESINEGRINGFSSQNFNQAFENNKSFYQIKKKSNQEIDCEEKALDPAYSPDSLVVDDPSSSSDYLSAAYSCSPGITSSTCHPHFDVGDTIIKMENIFTSSDSGLENTGTMESLSIHKDITLTDVSLTESTLHDLTITTDDANNSYESISSSSAEQNQSSPIKQKTASEISGTSALHDLNVHMPNHTNKDKGTVTTTSSKEEIKLQNEENVILESSSLSSETGSWESVFPHKMTTKDLCDKFLNNERQYSKQDEIKGKPGESYNFSEELCPSLVQKSPFKSSSCFIDAASLVDEEDETIKRYTDLNEITSNDRSVELPAPSQPVPCTTVKLDISPNDWSESNEHEDSLEQPLNKDLNSVQKDMSPTIFDMTPITEDSLYTNTFETAAAQDEVEMDQHTETQEIADNTQERVLSLSSNTLFVSNTPHNSFMTLKASALKHYESEESESDTTPKVGREVRINNILFKKYNESCPIVSGGASIEDHLPQPGSHSGSPIVRQKIENIPIVSGAYIPEVHENTPKKSPKPSSASAWIVDMSCGQNPDGKKYTGADKKIKKPGDRACNNLKKESKYHSIDNYNNSSSLDSDSSEKSSQKFYIDLSSFPDMPPSTQNNVENATKKKNMFSMYIDISENASLKEMPARLSSSLNTKRDEITTESKKVKTSTPVAGPSTEYPECSTFERIESLCNDPNISISEIICLPENNASKSAAKEDTAKHVTNFGKHSNAGGRPCNRHIVSASDQESSSDTEARPAEPFVKLSDLDNALKQAECAMSNKEPMQWDLRMTRSIPETNWEEINVTSSFHSENALSLNRLFPHLQNEFSRSMPGSLSARTRSPQHRSPQHRPGISPNPDEFDEDMSDISEGSSISSSVCQSVIEEASLSSSVIENCQSRLGLDLLRMYLEEIATDVMIEVSGRRIKAHKCILSSRCQYFAGILSGGWVESSGNVIYLPPFALDVVHFVLCHIYSGVSKIPDTISVLELATLTDMLGLEGLKEAIMFTLKAKYCHHFHTPCGVCTAGVVDCFPLTSVYGLDDLYRRCLKWISEWISLVWPTKAFGTLPKELQEKCLHQVLVDLTTTNALDVVYASGIATKKLRHIHTRWADTVTRMLRRLTQHVAEFLAPQLMSVLQQLGEQPAEPADGLLDGFNDFLAVAMDLAPPSQAVRVYSFFYTIERSVHDSHFSKPDLITLGDPTELPTQSNFLLQTAGFWRLLCECALVRNRPRVAGHPAFRNLPVCLQARVRQLGLMEGPQSNPFTTIRIQESRIIRAGPPANPFAANRLQPGRTRQIEGRPIENSACGGAQSSALVLVTRSLEIDQVRASFVPYAPNPMVAGGSAEFSRSSNDLRSRKSREPPKVRTTKAQEERAKFNMSKTYLSQDHLNSKAAAARIIHENTKPRYLVPRVCNEAEKRRALINAGAKLSSSESSRNSSPVMARNVRTSRLKARPGEARAQPSHAYSQDSLSASSRPRTADLSTDSQSDSQSANKYATYTKAKHTTKPSDEPPKRCQSAVANKPKTKIPVYLNQGSKPNSPKTKPINKEVKSISTQAKAISTEAKPISKEAKAISTEAKPISKEAKPISSEAKPVSTEAKPISTVAKPTSAVAKAMSTEAKPISKEAKPISTVAKPTSAVAKAMSTEAKPISKEAKPISSEATPEVKPSTSGTGSQKRPAHSIKSSKVSTGATSAANGATKVKASERKLLGSLMNATKSSSAKVVTKIKKEINKSPSKQTIRTTKGAKKPDEPEIPTPPPVPIMERSGTFLKDEPTFGDKTNDIDGYE